MSTFEEGSPERLALDRAYELSRHARESAALDIALRIHTFNPENRAFIRRRVQELLRCKDDPTIRAVTPYVVIGTTWNQESWTSTGRMEGGNVPTATPPGTNVAGPAAHHLSKGDDGHLHHFVSSPGDVSEVYCVNCAEARPLPQKAITGA